MHKFYKYKKEYFPALYELKRYTILYPCLSVSLYVVLFDMTQMVNNPVTKVKHKHYYRL